MVECPAGSERTLWIGRALYDLLLVRKCLEQFRFFPISCDGRDPTLSLASWQEYHASFKAIRSLHRADFVGAAFVAHWRRAGRALHVRKVSNGVSQPCLACVVAFWWPLIRYDLLLNFFLFSYPMRSQKSFQARLDSEFYLKLTGYPM